MATHEELIAHRMSIEEIRDHLHVDTLGYLSEEGLAETIGQPCNHLCLACFSGDYPLTIQAGECEKSAFDGTIG